jgi:hypothetical protein
LATIIVSNGGTLACTGNSLLGIESVDFLPGRGVATLLVSGAGSAFSGGSLVLGGGNSSLSGGKGIVRIEAGGRADVQALAMGQDDNGLATVTVDGSGSRLNSVGIGAGTGDWIIGARSGASGTLNVQNDASASTGGSLIIAPGQDEGFGDSSGIATVNAATLTIGGQLHIAGSAGTPGGTATLSILNGGVVSATGHAVVYAPGTLTVGAGSTPATFRTNGNLSVDGHVNYNAGTLISGGTLSVGGSVFLSSAGSNQSNKKTLEVGGASLTSSGVIDLNDNDLLVHANQKQYLTQQIAVARHGGAWDQPGITSTAAKNNPQHNTTLGLLSGAEYSAANGGTTQFDGRAFAPGDTLVKYTYYGDTDLNGRVNFDDYVRIDHGFNDHLTGWLNGDFDGNGQVNFDDYVLIDLAFNTQSGVLARVPGDVRAGPDPVRTIVSAIRPMPRAVPEPGAIGTLVIASHAARRRRRSALRW